MEWSATVQTLLLRLTWEQLLYTHATLGSFLRVTWWDRVVGVRPVSLEPGMELIRAVQVLTILSFFAVQLKYNIAILYKFHCVNWYFHAAITCSRLTDPSNGVITYTTDTTAPFNYQTTATYSCDNGFRLSAVGNTIRNCVGSTAGPGEWSGAAPFCEGILTLTKLMYSH